MTALILHSSESLHITEIITAGILNQIIIFSTILHFKTTLPKIFVGGSGRYVVSWWIHVSSTAMY